jgi:hypothetical protein
MPRATNVAPLGAAFIADSLGSNWSIWARTTAPPCKQYTAFLKKHKEEMKPAYAKLVLVDIRTWLKGPALTFQIYNNRYTVAEFKALVGDANKGLFYPTWWLLTPEGKQVRQLPQASTHLTSVANHIRLLEGS